ncbi:xenotropic and polytropic retrovirus receptor 1 [Lingula anatina]|uniref:Xenotropic and polytropic retrovirus receptor 1 n=1 Tax=Lingula anatina TaxID=7574 RepID=A0A1S3J063_LINAN|nr:xenotropic and polytropic retrovirus receptor 1 [Lingula anatina]|eukprot:XP_013403648.1 xenotropic and polytropic retrovirus receptor 1 [Lingula anatina]
MKFGEHLAAHTTPEWRKQDIQYETMKEALYECVEGVPSAEEVDPETIERYYAKFDEKFLQKCDKELKKINTFFAEKLAEAVRKYESLKAELEAFKRIHMASQETNLRRRKQGGQLQGLLKLPAHVVQDKSAKTTRKIHDLKLAYSEFYLSLILLQNYQTLNFTGFRKILKKHDKVSRVLF